MPSLAALAPEHRAALELVLRRGRSYGELAELLDLPEAVVRARAHAALLALLPPAGVGAEEAALVADELLVRRDAGVVSAEGVRWREALERATAELRPEAPAVGGATAPRADGDVRRGMAHRPATGRAAEPRATEQGDAQRAGISPTAHHPAPASAARAAGRRRRLAWGDPVPRRRTALLVGGLLALLAVAVGGLLLAGAREDAEPPVARARATATPAPTPPALEPVGEVTLRGTGAAPRGVMALFRAADGRLAFTIDARRLPESAEGEAYAVWFLPERGGPRRLGFTDPVGEDGRLVVGGPRARDADRFPRLLAAAEEVVLARARSERATRPGRVVLRGRIAARVRAAAT